MALLSILWSKSAKWWTRYTQRSAFPTISSPSNVIVADAWLCADCKAGIVRLSVYSIYRGVHPHLVRDVRFLVASTLSLGRLLSA